MHFWIPSSRNSMKFLRKETSVNSLVESTGFEPVTSCLQGRRSPSWAKPPYFRKWWAKMDSNHRPHDYQSCALASWAIGPYWISSLHKKWWRLAGSNRWPPACKAGALPAELNPHIHSLCKLKWWAWTRFPAGKPRRLQQSTGLLLRAAFRVHFGVLPFRTLKSRS